jgi:hypothetical protein
MSLGNAYNKNTERKRKRKRIFLYAIQRKIINERNRFLLVEEINIYQYCLSFLGILIT